MCSSRLLFLLGLLFTFCITPYAQPLYSGSYVSLTSSPIAGGSVGYTLQYRNLSVANNSFTLALTVAATSAPDTPLQYVISGQVSCTPSRKLILSVSSVSASCKALSSQPICNLLIDECTGEFGYSITGESSIERLYGAPPDVAYLVIVNHCGVTDQHVLTNGAPSGDEISCLQSQVSTNDGDFSVSFPINGNPLVNAPSAVDVLSMDITTEASAMTISFSIEPLASSEPATVILNMRTGCAAGGLLSVAGVNAGGDCSLQGNPVLAGFCTYFLSACTGLFSYDTYIDPNSGAYQLVLYNFCGLAGSTRLTCNSGCTDNSVSCLSSGTPASVDNITPGPGIETTPNPDGTVTITNKGVLSITGGTGVSTNCTNGNCVISSTGVVRISAGRNTAVSCTGVNCTVASTLTYATVSTLLIGENCASWSSYDSDLNSLNIDVLGVTDINWTYGYFCFTFAGATSYCGYNPIDAVDQVAIQMPARIRTPCVSPTCTATGIATLTATSSETPLPGGDVHGFMSVLYVSNGAQGDVVATLPIGSGTIGDFFAGDPTTGFCLDIINFAAFKYGD